MSGKSLRDQLLQLGIATSAPPKKKPKTRRRPQATAGAGDDISLAQAYAIRRKEEKLAIKQSAERKREEARRRKELNDAISALVKPAALNQPDAPLDRFFEYQGKIRKIFVTEQQQAQLTAGQIGIVSLRGGFLLVPPEIARRVAALKPEAVALAPEETTKS